MKLSLVVGTLLGALASSSILTSSSIAVAQTAGEPTTEGAPEEAPRPIEHPLTLDLDAVFITRTSTFDPNALYDEGDSRTTNTLLSSILAGRYRARSLELEMEVPWVLGVTSFFQESEVGGTFGNVTTGAFYAHDFEGGRLRAGGILALPTSPGSSSTVVEDVVASRGADRIWHWAPKAFTLAPSVRFTSHEGDGFQHASEIVVAPIVPTSGGHAVVFLQLSEDLSGQTGLFRAGARAELVANTHARTDALQLSVLPYAGVRAATWFADAGMLINVTAPYGFSFDHGKAWGLRARVGVCF